MDRKKNASQSRCPVKVQTAWLGLELGLDFCTADLSPWRWVLLGSGYLHTFPANSTRCTWTQGQVTLFLCSKPSSGSHVLKPKFLQWLPMPGVTWPPISFQPCLFPLSASHTPCR